MKHTKQLIAIRINRLLNNWYKKEANRQKMSKSELIRKALTLYKEKKNDS